MDVKLIAKSMLIWALILPLAILNGALREFVFIPFTEAAAYPLSGLLLCLLALLVSFALLPRLGRSDRKTYQLMGICWLVATVLFETLLGLAEGLSPDEILAAYAFTDGNLWLLVVIFLGFVPWITAYAKKLYK